MLNLYLQSFISSVKIEFQKFCTYSRLGEYKNLEHTLLLGTLVRYPGFDFGFSQCVLTIFCTIQNVLHFFNPLFKLS